MDRLKLANGDATGLRGGVQTHSVQVGDVAGVVNLDKDDRLVLVEPARPGDGFLIGTQGYEALYVVVDANRFTV